MQPTVPPWAWVTWERRSRARASPPDYRSHVRLLPRAHDDNFPFYGLRKDSRHFIRLDSLGKLLNRPWAASSAPVTWRIDHYHDGDAWRGDLKSYRPYEPVSIVLPASGGAVGQVAGAGGAAGAGEGAEGAGGAGWGQAARGWAAGALLLALLVMLVRAAENCLHKKLFKAIYLHTNVGAGIHQQETMQGQYIYTANGVRRQESDEWSTPNVTATSLQNQVVSLGSLSHLTAATIFAESNLDLPPPYSACAGEGPAGEGESADGGAGGGAGGAGEESYKHEEPPPPYSACVVSYSRAPPGEPAVRIHHPRPRARHPRTSQPRTSIDNDNAQNDLIESGHRSAILTTDPLDTGGDSATRTELVFDNGRIIERVSPDNNTDNGSTHERDVDQPGEAGKDYVVYVNEEVSTGAAPRTLLV